MILLTNRSASCFMLLCLLQAACRPQETKPACGCEGPPHAVLIDKLAVYSRGTVQSLNLVSLTVDGYYALTCNPGFTTGKVADNDTVLISGNVRTDCFEGETLTVLPSLLELTAIRKR